jgi:peptidyl-prolyl cis-trans isomerase C
MKLCLLLAALAATLCAQGPAPAGVPPDTVVAKVDGKDVTAGEVRKILEDAGPQFAQAFRANPTVAVRDFFVISFLAEEGEKLKLAEQSPWKEQLEISRVNLIANAMVNHERDNFGISTEEIEKYYERNQAHYEQAKIKVISITFKPPVPSGTSPDAVKAAAEAFVKGARNTRPEEEAKTLAADIVKQARAGADFAQLVAQYSDDPISKASGGDFGVVKSTSSYPNDIKKAVFALKPGEVSDPVRQPSADDIIPCQERSLQAIGEVREVIVQEIRQAHLGEFLKDLQARFMPKIEKPEFFSQPPAVSPVPPKPPSQGNPAGPAKP